METTEIIEKPVEIITDRLKRNYLRNGKTAPAGVKVYTSEKSGKQYMMKILGTKNYIME